MGVALLGAYQRPVLNQDPSIAAIPGGATLTAVTAKAPTDAGNILAVVTADVPLVCTLTCGANSQTVTGASVALEVASTPGATLTLTARAATGPAFRVQAQAAFVPAGVIIQASDLFALFTAAGQLFVGTGNGSGELLAAGPPGDVLTMSGGLPAWVAPGAVGAPFVDLGELWVGTAVAGVGALLEPGSTGQLLTIAAGTPAWTTLVALANLPRGTAGQVLTAQGAGSPPAYAAPPSNAGAILGHTAYYPGSPVTYTSTNAGTTPTVVDATNLTVSFTAPASGNVEVRVTGAWDGGSGVLPVMVPHGTTTAVTTASPLGAGATNQLPLTLVLLATGLTPGANLQWDLAAIAVGTFTFLHVGNPTVAGSNYAPCVIDVVAL